MTMAMMRQCEGPCGDLLRRDRFRQLGGHGRLAKLCKRCEGPQMALCRKCRAYLPLSGFGPDPMGTREHDRICRGCRQTSRDCEQGQQTGAKVS